MEIEVADPDPAGLVVRAHVRGSWFLLEDVGAPDDRERWLLDVRCDQGPVTGSVLIALDDAERAAWRDRGRAAVQELAQRVADSAPLARVSTSPYRQRDLTPVAGDRVGAAIRTFLGPA